MSKTKAPAICVPLDKAKHILLAKAIEEHAQEQWTASDSSLLSMRVAHSLGENASPERYLTERAERLIEEADAKGVSVKVSTKTSLPTILGLLLVVFAFVCGALSDRLTGSDHFINLLSAPFWGIVLWNLLAYLIILLSAIGILGSERRLNLPLRGSLLSLVQKCSASPFAKGHKAAFFESWGRFTAPLTRIRIARTLHLAAICFALGLIVSLLVRGLSTAYWVGWESTWLADRADIVKTILDSTYGLIPAIGGLPAMPDAVAVAGMRADMLPYAQNEVTAAPWLIRMILILAASVIIPRLVLALVNTWRLKVREKNSKLEISEPYFQELLAESAQNAALGSLKIIAPEKSSPDTQTFLQTILKSWGEPGDNALVTANLSDPEAPMPEIDVQGKTLIVLALEGASTPEYDVHGAIIDSAVKQAEVKQAAIVGLLNMTSFAARQKAYPDRIEQRINGWIKFASEHGLPLVSFNAQTSDPAETVKQLRMQCAALVVRSDNQASKDS